MTEKWHYDNDTDTLTIYRESDVEPLIEWNKKQYNESDGRFTSEGYNHVARVDEIVLETWAKMKGVSYQELMNNDKLLFEFLNDPDNRYMRTMPGRL